jgi:uncharacterized protein YqhQ
LNNSECNKCKKTSIGGQALIEGVMMRGPEKTVLSVRTPDGSIVTEDVDFKPFKNKCKLLGLPIIRGVVGLIESLMMGYKTLMRSAELSGMTDLEDEEDKNTEKTEEQKAKDEKKQSIFMNILMGVASVLGVALALFLFMWVPTAIFNGINYLSHDAITPFRGLIEGLMKIAIFIVYILLVSQMNDIKRVFMYHGAEHKTIFCYEHGLDLTVENVRIQRRFHPRCGTSFMFLMIAVGIIISTVISLVFPQLTKFSILWAIIKILMIPLFCGIGYELIKFCGRHDNVLTKIIAAPGLWIQRITTKEPDDSMIEVAIRSFVAVIPEDKEADNW